MKFKITRTSIWDDEMPCDNCVKVKRQYLEDGLKYDYEEWQIEINTMEELIDLQKEVDHPLIITDGEIEIYDDLRE